MREVDVLLYLVCVYDPEVRDLIEPFDFSSPALQLLFRVVQELQRRHRSLIRPSLVLQHFEDVARGKLTAEEIEDVKSFFEAWIQPQQWTAAETDLIRTKIIAWVKERRAKRLINKATELISRGETERIPSLFRSLLSLEVDSQVVDYVESFNKRVEEWALLTQRKGISLPMELGKFKAIYPQEVGVLLSSPKIGKSFILAFFGAHAVVLNKAKVVHFTLEMPSVVVGMRYDLILVNNFANLPYKILDVEYIANRDQIRSVIRSLVQDPARLIIVDVPRKNAYPSSLEAKFEQILERLQSKVDLVLIDYANLIKSERVRDQSQLFAVGSDVFEWLHDFAKTYDVAVWTIARTTRKAIEQQESNQVRSLKVKLRGSSVGQSYAIIYDCDHVITLSDLTQSQEGALESRILSVDLDYSRRAPSFYGYQLEIHYPTATFIHPPRSRISSASTPPPDTGRM